MIAIFGFIGAAVLFVIWKIMGSQESFETAYRGGAYTAAIMPGTAILNLIPYLGSLIGLVWMTFLLVVISMEMHGIKQKTAWTGFGVICAIFAMMSLSAEVAGRKMEKNMQAWQQENVLDLEQLQDATPEEVGKVLGQFLKGIQEAAEQSK
jgi:ABC-type bacteriocin/lantibiotic exporter with double-glycine peptidase domain